MVILLTSVDVDKSLVSSNDKSCILSKRAVLKLIAYSWPSLADSHWEYTVVKYPAKVNTKITPTIKYALLISPPGFRPLSISIAIKIGSNSSKITSIDFVKKPTKTNFLFLIYFNIRKFYISLFLLD